MKTNQWQFQCCY